MDDEKINKRIIEEGRKGYRLRRNNIGGNPYEPYSKRYFLWQEGYEEEHKRVSLETGQFKGRMF